MPAKKRSTGSNASKKTKIPKAWFASAAVLVSDRGKARDWYTQKLGLDVLSNDDHWITVGRKGQGAMIHLCQVSEAGDGAQLEPGNSGFLLLVPGKLGPISEVWKERGVEFTEPPTDAPWGTYAVVRDPDGNDITIMEG
ncbi:MAG: VOC family protein [Thermoplasmata archaeon]